MVVWNRRNFLQSAGALGAASLAPRLHALGGSPSIAANDHIQIALIGAGGQGQSDAKTAVELPGVRLVAAADCYDGRLEHARELWGRDILATRDYREVLARADVDAVLIATPDHWHKQITIDALRAGKHVYCEKPMVHALDEGPAVIAAAAQSGRVLQIGSQRVSSIVYMKARDLLQAGAIGTLNTVTAQWNRNTSMGAWNYTVPPDASPQTCDWNRFLGFAPPAPFSAERFFQWRKWKDYGTGVAGDLFVHLFSGTHFVTGAHGPTRAMATGGLRYWKDGRDANDVLLGLFDYPQGFNLSLQVNFVAGGPESSSLVFTGSEGRMEIGWDGVTLSRVPRETAPGLTIDTFPEAMQKQIEDAYRRRYPRPHPQGPPLAAVERFAAPAGYSDDYDHFRNFFAALRTGQPVVEDAVFGYRAAGAALLANLSIDKGTIVHWDPEAMRLA